jgi:hypothetical protein
MFLGIFFTIAVSVVLMALIFYSHNTGYDSHVQAAQKEEQAMRPGELRRSVD